MNPLLHEYMTKCQEILGRIAEQEEAALQEAAGKIARAYCAGKTIYVFGCTHSAILAEDVFYRAGAPAFWRPLWGPGMTISSTPGFLTSAAEHNEGLGKEIIKCSRLQAGDVILIASTSGKNGAPVAVAEEAIARGADVILLTSFAYKDQKGNHSRIPNLYALREKALLIDNHVPVGDASIEVENCPMAPVSTIAGSFIMQSISALAVEKIVAAGKIPPVFKSSNAPGGLEHNLALLEKPGVKEAFTLP